MKKKHIILFALIVSFICGCANTYVPPSQGPRATLIAPARLTNYEFMGKLLSSYVQFAIDAEDGCGNFYEPIESAYETKVAETIIPAEKEIYLKVTFIEDSRVCSSAGYFYAEKNKRYVVEPVDYEIFCQVKVFEEISSKNKQKITLKEAFIIGTAGTRACKTRR